jgi:hypothetical protein
MKLSTRRGGGRSLGRASVAAVESNATATTRLKAPVSYALITPGIGGMTPAKLSPNSLPANWRPSNDRPAPTSAAAVAGHPATEYQH